LEVGANVGGGVKEEGAGWQMQSKHFTCKAEDEMMKPIKIVHDG
jgi:hypothetical protein